MYFAKPNSYVMTEEGSSYLAVCIYTHSISVSVLARSVSDPAFAALADSFADFALSRALTASASALFFCARASSRSDSA